MRFILILLLVSVRVCFAQLSPLPVQEYDYHTPEAEVSPIAIGMGGMNLTNPKDYYGSYSNPAILASIDRTSLALSYRLVNQQQLSFYEAMSASNVLKDKQIKYFSLVSKNAAISYQPVSSIHISQSESNGVIQYYDYQLDKWQVSLGGKDNEWNLLSAGINVKYLSGRLVYLREKISGINLIREAFIDDKVKGVSADMGFILEQGDFVWGAAFYDLFSRLWWENYDSVSLQRRSAVGFEYRKGDLSMLAGMQSKIAKEPEPTFHFGLIQDWNWQSSGIGGAKPTSQNIILRLGMYSEDFYGTQNINYTLGSGYYYNIFRFDFALSNQGMRLKDSEYLFSIAVGLQ